MVFNLILAIAILLASPFTHASSRTDIARSILRMYVVKHHSFDPSIADLYSDSAVITIRRTDPEGFVKDTKMTGSEYKQLIRDNIETTRSIGDVADYSGIVFREEPAGVRVTVDRYSKITSNKSPLSLLIGPDATQQWLILEETSVANISGLVYFQPPGLRRSTMVFAALFIIAIGAAILKFHRPSLPRDHWRNKSGAN